MKPALSVGRVIRGSATAVAFLLILAPIAVVVVAAFSPADYFDFPPPGVSLRWFVEFFRLDNMRSAFTLSLELALLSATIATILGTMGALFAVQAAALGLQRVARGKVRGAAEPAGEHGLPAEAAGLASEDDEDRLRDFLGQVRVAHLPSRGGMDQSDVALDQPGEGGFRAAGGVVGEQFGIAGRLHVTR